MMKNYNIQILFILFLVISHILPFFTFDLSYRIYMGIPYNVVDTNTYFSFMQQAKEGHLLFTNRYTPENVPHLIFSPVYLILGWFTLFLSQVLAYYLFKFIFLILFVYLVY